MRIAIVVAVVALFCVAIVSSQSALASADDETDPGKENAPNEVLRQRLFQLYHKVLENRKFSKEAKDAMLASAQELERLDQSLREMEQSLLSSGISEQTLNSSRRTLQADKLNADAIENAIAKFGPEKREEAVVWAELVLDYGRVYLELADFTRQVALLGWLRVTEEQLYIETKHYVDSTQKMAEAAVQLANERSEQMKRGVHSPSIIQALQQAVEDARVNATAAKGNGETLKSDLTVISNKVAADSETHGREDYCVQTREESLEDDCEGV